MNPLTAHIATALKEARELKSLTQRGLSARSGVPQAKISRIEREGADMQITTLISLARALDLEVELVPRKALPALETIVRSTATTWSDPGKRFRDLRQALQNVTTPDIPSTTLEELQSHIRMLANFPPTAEVMAEVKSFTTWLSKAKSPDLATFDRHAREIKRLRKELAHARLPDSPPRPAYSLDDEDDDDA